MEQFSVDLVSNASILDKRFPNNTTTSFSNYLSQPINLIGNWKCGLTKICVPFLFNNLTEGKFKIHPTPTSRYAFNWTRDIDCSITGQFSTFEEIVAALNQEVSTRSSEDWDDLTWKSEAPINFDDEFILETETQLSGKTKIKVSKEFGITFLSDDITCVLGVEKNVRYDDYIYGNHFADIQRIHTVYVYCDILDYALVGDTQAQLLTYFVMPSFVRKLNTKKRVTVFEKEFHNPMFRKILGNNIQDIRIDLRDAFGQKIQFLNYGNCNVTLKFIKISN